MSQDTTLKKLQVVLTGNTQQLQTAMNQAQQATNRATGQIEKGLSKVDSAFKKVAKAAATYISVRALVNFGKSCVELGSDLSEVQNVVDTTFGSMSSSVDAFAKDAIKQFGLSETAAKRYSSTMGAMLKSMGLNQQQTLSMSTTLAGLAGDMASFYNISTDEAFSKIRSGISGETEPLKQLGINLSVANLEAYALSQGITKSYQSMTQAEQAILRYNYLLKSTTDAQGDFAKTSESWANQVRILKENFNSLKATIGQGLIMALTPVIKLINTLLEGLQKLAERFKLLMAVVTGQDLNEVFGTGTSGADASENLTADMGAVSGYAADTSDSVEDIADGMEDAAKQAKKFLLSFDEIHKLEGSDETKTTADSDKINSLIDASALSGLDEASAKMDEFKSGLPMSDEEIDALKQQFQPIIDVWENEIWPRVQNIGEKLGEFYENHLKGFFESVGDLVSTLWEDVLKPFTKWLADTGIPKLIELVGKLTDTAKGVTDVASGVIDSVTGTLTGDEAKRAEGGQKINEGNWGAMHGYVGFWAWLADVTGVSKDLFGVDNAQQALDEAWAQTSSDQKLHQWLSELDPVIGELLDPYDLLQYVTPEMESRKENGTLTAEDMLSILNQKYNPWGDYQYAIHWGEVTGEIPEEILDVFREQLEMMNQEQNVYGNTNPPVGGDNTNPPEDDKLTKKDFMDYMDRLVEAITAETESDLIIDGVVAGTQLIKKYLANNMTKNPEVTVV